MPDTAIRPGTARVLAQDETAGAAVRAALAELGAAPATDATPDVCCVTLVCNDAYGAADPEQRLPREHVLDVARAMARRGGGRMVLVTDCGPQVHSGGSAELAAARAADLAWWRHLASAVAPDGVRMNTAAFGYAPFLGHALPADTESELLRHLLVRRPAAPADLVGVLGLLTSPGPCYLVGETIALDGGMDLDLIPAPRASGGTRRAASAAAASAASVAEVPPAGSPVTLVLGASSGIGRAAALRLAEQGSDIVLAARRRGALEEAAEQIAKLGRRVWVLPCDAADAAAVTALAEQSWRAAGRVDRLLYAAGRLEFGAEHTGTRAWDQTFAVNLGGYSTLSSDLVRRWAAAAIPGAIAAVSSVSSTSVPVTRVEAYGASKAAMVQYSRCLAASAARYGVRVNCVCPGIIDTPMGEAARPDFRDGWLSRIPAGRIGQPEDVAAVLDYLLGPAAGYVTGARIRIDGGYGLGGLPPLAARPGAAR